MPVTGTIFLVDNEDLLESIGKALSKTCSGSAS
jgi:hypothetical protein